MPANLTPQYLDAEAEFKKAQSAEERLECLRKMWALLPKHKGTDKMQADLKAKMSDLKKEVEVEKKSGKKGGVSHRIPKQGAGQYVLLGGPNAGKSSLLAKTTKADAQVAPFPFTTHAPKAGMMPWEDVQVQLVDLPPITADFFEPYISSIVRAADAALLFVDLADDDGPFAAETVVVQLEQRKSVLVGAPPEEQDDFSVAHIKTMLVANKIDADGADDRLEIVQEMFGDRFPVHRVSLEQGTGVEEFRNALYQFLNVIRVYTKQPGKPADMKAPYTCPHGSTVVDLAAQIHRDFAENLKSARIWGTGVHDGQAVARDHVLNDRDVIEIHV